MKTTNIVNVLPSKGTIRGYDYAPEQGNLVARKGKCAVYIPITNDDVPKAIRALEKALGF